MRNHSYENDFDLHENETACRTHLYMKGFALRLVFRSCDDSFGRLKLFCISSV